MPSTNDPRELNRIFNRAVTRTMCRIVLDTTEGLIETTPVLTGWARANWVPSTGDPVDTTNGSREQVTTVAQSNGTAQVFAHMASESREPLFVTNNVSYIEKLNAGSSRKAPAGFVDAIVAGAIDKARSRGEIV